MIFVTTLLFMATSCHNLFLDDEPDHNPVATFDEFWKGVDLTWPAFESKQVNWDSLYSVYRPQVAASTSTAELTRVLSALTSALSDAHTNIYPTNGPPFPPYPTYPAHFYGISWIRSNYLRTVKGNQAIAYGKINASIGYIYIGTFANAAAQYEIIDAILNEFDHAKGIIIDVRGNGGGNSANSQTIASRFVDQHRVYAFSKWRKGRARDHLTEFFPAEIAPAGTHQFTRPVAVLVNRYSFSATEDFLLMMRALPQVRLVGDYSGGGSETRPLMKELPNGWAYRVSSRLMFDAQKQLISQGIAPDFLVAPTRADSLRGKDSIIEKAVFELSK